MNKDNWMNILLQLTDELKGVYQNALKAVLLYGSVARGTAGEDSDIDIMVVVDLPQDRLKAYEDRLCDISTDFALEYFKVFSIIDVSYSEYEEWKEILPFYKNVEKEGITLYAA